MSPTQIWSGSLSFQTDSADVPLSLLLQIGTTSTSSQLEEHVLTVSPPPCRGLSCDNRWRDTEEQHAPVTPRVPSAPGARISPSPTLLSARKFGSVCMKPCQVNMQQRYQTSNNSTWVILTWSPWLRFSTYLASTSSTVGCTKMSKSYQNHFAS